MSRQITDIITFTQCRLNSDVDVEFMPKGNFPVDPSLQISGIINLIPQKGNLGILTNPKGTTQRTLGDSVFAKILAGVFDHENNALILICYGTIGYGGANNQILRYNNNNTTTKIKKDNAVSGDGGLSLELALTEIINGLFIIGSGTEAQLGWASADNAPRLLNISRGINTEFSSTEDWFSLAVDSPDGLLSATVGQDTGYVKNNIYNKGYQFAYKYIYFDGKESCVSDYTEPVYPALENETFDGLFEPTLTYYNKITLTKTGIPDGVSKVRIYHRYVEDPDTGEPSYWYEYDTINVTSNTITYDFYDNKPKAVADQDEMAYPFYDVPLYANGATLLSDNRIALFNPTKGYDNVDIEVVLETLYEASALSPNYSASLTTVLGGTLGGTASFSFNTVEECTLSLVFVLQGAVEYSFNIKINIGLSTDDYSYQIAEFATKYITDHSIYNLTVTRTGLNTVDVTVSAYYNCYVYENYVKNSECRVKSQPTGATHYLAIGYEDDKGRKGRANISADSLLSIPTLTEMNKSYIDNYQDRFAIGLTITSLAPTWATKWEPLYGGSNIANSYRIPLICNSDEAAVTADIALTDGYITYDVEAADNRILEKNPKFDSLITFDAQKGDRIRFLAKTGRETFASANWKILDYWFLFDNIIDLDIIDVDASTGVITTDSSVIGSEISDIIGNGSYDLIMVEVYRIDKEVTAENRIYQSIGQKGDIVNRYHQYVTESGTWLWSKVSDNTSFSPRNQTASLSGMNIIICDGFNVYAHFYDMGNDGDDKDLSLITGFIQLHGPSLSYASKYALGKVNYVDEQFEQRTIRGVQWGYTYSEEGLIFNELNKFVEGDIMPVDDRYGDVYGAIQVGDSLRVFQQSKVSSMGVGTRRVYNADGTYTLVTTDAVLNEPNYYDDDYGTVFSKSIVPHKSHIYFFDIYNHCLVRNATNGNEDVSRYDMANFFEARCKALLVSGVDNLDVSAVYDEILDMYVLTVIDSVTSTNSFTVAFHEKSNSWSLFFSHLPDGYAKIGEQRIFGFKYPSLYLHEFHNNVTRNNFFGTQYTSYITMIFNEAIGLTKVYESLHINSNSKNWGSPNNDDIEIHEDGSTYEDSDNYTRHKTKMQSRLKVGLFKLREGLFKAQYLRNMITTSSTPSQKDLRKGNVLRGRYMKQTLRNSDTTEVHLRSVTNNSSVSSGS